MVLGRYSKFIFGHLEKTTRKLINVEFNRLNNNKGLSHFSVWMSRLFHFWLPCYYETGICQMRSQANDVFPCLLSWGAPFAISTYIAALSRSVGVGGAWWAWRVSMSLSSARAKTVLYCHWPCLFRMRPSLVILVLAFQTADVLRPYLFGMWSRFSSFWFVALRISWKMAMNAARLWCAFLDGKKIRASSSGSVILYNLL